METISLLIYENNLSNHEYLLEIEHVLARGDELGGAEAVAVGEEDHGAVAVAVPAVAVAGGLTPAPDLPGGKELARADVGVADASRRHCPVNDGWRPPSGGRWTFVPYQRVDETRLQAFSSGSRLTTSIAASVSMATVRTASAAPSTVVRASRRAEARARNSLGVPAPTRRRMTSPRL